MTGRHDFDALCDLKVRQANPLLPVRLVVVLAVLAIALFYSENIDVTALGVALAVVVALLLAVVAWLHFTGAAGISGMAVRDMDWNGDGQVTITDMVRLQAYLLGRGTIQPN